MNKEDNEFLSEVHILGNGMNHDMTYKLKQQKAVLC